MKIFQRVSVALWLGLSLTLYAAAPTAVINASPTSGAAPLAVAFDAGLSSADVTYLWEFGEGSASTAKSVTHVYTVAGTYTATLTVTNSAGESGTAQVSITATGTGQGPVTADMNFRWAINNSSFTLNHATTRKDKFTLVSTFNTVDLPDRLQGLAASFSINDVFTVSGVLGQEGIFVSPGSKPFYEVTVDKQNQQLLVYISGATLGPALGASGAGNIAATQLRVPIKLTLTIGAQTYILTERYAYTSTAGGTGRGQFNLKQQVGAVQDGFFVVYRASAVENVEGTGHYFEFETYLSRPALAAITTPGAGTYTFRFHESDPVVVLFDRLRTSGTKINYEQPDRAVGGVSRFTIDVATRRMTLRTWDLHADAREGGTGLPLKGDNFTAFNFTLRLDLQQLDGTTLQAVTATRMTRLTVNDAFWQTGRKGKKR